MRTVKPASQDVKPKQRPAETPEARENQMIALAVDAVEKRIREGTASSAEYVHFLKLASSKNKLESEKLELEKQLLAAKTEALQSEKRLEDLYTNAIAAMQLYSGRGGDDEDDSDIY